MRTPVRRLPLSLSPAKARIWLGGGGDAVTALSCDVCRAAPFSITFLMR